MMDPDKTETSTTIAAPPTPTASPASTSLFGVVDMDVWGEILLSLDFDSAQRLYHDVLAVASSTTNSTTTTSSNTKKKQTFHHVWKTMYGRQFFTPIDTIEAVEEEEDDDNAEETVITKSVELDIYERLIYQRRQLLSNLFQNDNKKKKQNKKKKRTTTTCRGINRCFNLPNRYFHFHPIVPSDFLSDDDDMMTGVEDHEEVREQEEDGMEIGADNGRRNPRNDVAGDGSMMTTDTTTTGVSPWTDLHHQHHYQQQDRLQPLPPPPPVIFECDSFVLTSPGISSEIVILDPFDGKLVVYNDVLTQCIDYHRRERHQHLGGYVDDSSCYETAMLNMIAPSQHTHRPNQQRQRRQQSQQPPQVLLSDDEYFTFDITPYFPPPNTASATSTAGTNGPPDRMAAATTAGQRDNGDEFDLSFLGIESRPIMDFEYDGHNNIDDDKNAYRFNELSSSSSVLCGSKITGFMVGVGRTVSNIYHDHMVCSELTLWKKQHQPRPQQPQKCAGIHNNKSNTTKMSSSSTPPKYDTKYVCRFRSNLELVDFDPRSERVFVLSHNEHGSNNDVSYSTSRRRSPTKLISIYPMIRCCNDDDDDDVSSSDTISSSLHTSENIDNDMMEDVSDVEVDYFPDPVASIRCDGEAHCFALDGAGHTLVVGTSKPSIELWDVRTPVALSSGYRTIRTGFIPRRIQTLNVRRSIRTSIHDFIEIANSFRKKQKASSKGKTDTQTQSMQYTNTPGSPTNSNPAEEELDDAHDISLVVLGRQPNLPHFCAPVDSIYIPKHLHAESAGFVTLHYSRDEGSSLVLWRRIGDDPNETNNKTWKASSIINLRLSSRRKPRVTYDGNRIIVLGEDHIGVIILVYQTSNVDGPFPIETDFEAMTSEHSGGVYNLTNPPQVRFVNRIRHVALGGIHRFDTLHLSSNERFIIVNTKTGDLLSGSSSPFSDGLLVIDLMDGSK